MCTGRQPESFPSPTTLHNLSGECAVSANTYLHALYMSVCLDSVTCWNCNDIAEDRFQKTYTVKMTGGKG